MKRAFVIGLLWTFSMGMSAQGSQVHETRTVESTLMKRNMHYSVYLPAGYTFSQKTYPILYLLHGAGDNHTAWIQKGKVQQIVDKAVASGIIDPLVIIMPDAGMTYYMNSIDGESPYEDYFFQEFIPYIERTYRITAGKRYRSIAGFSMGGYGALLYAIHRSDFFNSCVALSSGIRTDEQILQLSDHDYNVRYQISLGPANPEVPRITEYYRERYSILHLVAEIPDKLKKAVRFYIDCGDDDFLYKGNSLLHILMRDRNVPHEYRVRNGGHTWNYWKEGLANGLLFIQSGIR